MQGMLNRTEPLIWLGPDGMLRNYLAEQRGYAFLDHRSDNFAELLARLAPRFNGVIVYPEQPSDCAVVAFNLANINFCLPVSELTYQQFRNPLASLPVVTRIDGTGMVRGAAYDWLVANVLPRCDRRSAFSINQAFSDNNIPAGECAWDAAADIPFRFRSFLFNLSGLPERSGGNNEAAMFRNVMSGLPPPAMIFRWNTAEAIYSSYGHLMGHCQNAGNSSFIASVPIRGAFSFQQNSTPKIERPENKLYVAFVSNEGDTLRLMAHGYWGAWNHPDRGSAPMNWAICPAYVEYFPCLFEYYYETRTPNDTFCMGPTGGGYVHTDLMSPAHVDLFLRETERLCHDLLDLHDIVAWGSNNLDVWTKMAALPSVRLVLPKPNGGPDIGRLYHLDIGSKRVPVLREGFGHYWITRTAAYQRDAGTQLTPAGLAKELHDRHAALEQPSFFVLYSLEGEAPRFIRQLQALLDPQRVQLVDLGTFAQLLRQTPADCPNTPREPEVADPVRLDAATIRDSSKWQPVNGAEIAVVAEGLKVELAQGTWGGATLTNVRLPADATGLKIGIASLRVGRWETRVSGVHTSRDQPAETSSFVGIQVAAGQQGPYPDATFRSDFDPRVVWKIRRGEVLPSISIIFSDALPGDALIVSTLVPE